MDIFSSMQVSASALRAQQTRMNTISSNLANIDTTQAAEGGPYRKKSVVFQSASMGFSQELQAASSQQPQGVQVSRIIEDQGPPKMVYDPSHPDANDDGYVAKPNVNLLKEITNMKEASNAYEANVATVKSTKRMALKALEIGK